MAMFDGCFQTCGLFSSILGEEYLVDEHIFGIVEVTTNQMIDGRSILTKHSMCDGRSRPSCCYTDGG